jgi:hypothetical protein
MNIFILTTLFFVSSAFSCPNGLVMNKTLNRCLTSDEVARVMNKTSSCGLTDHECYRKNAEDELNNKAQMDKKYKNVNSTVAGEAVKNSVNAAAVAAPLMIVTSKIKDQVSGCSSISFWSLVAGSASLVAGEKLANYQHELRLKKLKETLEKKFQGTGSSDTNSADIIQNGNDNQSEAFEMLAQAEDSMVIAAKTKKTFFGVARAAFATSAAMAIFEMTPWGRNMAYCETNKDKREKKEEIAALKTDQIKTLSPTELKPTESKKDIQLPKSTQINNLEKEIDDLEKKIKDKKYDPLFRPGAVGVEKISEEEYQIRNIDYFNQKIKLDEKKQQLNLLINKNNGSHFQNLKINTKVKEKISFQKKKSQDFSAQNSNYNLFKEKINRITNILIIPFSKIFSIQESIAQDKSFQNKQVPWNDIGKKLYDPPGRGIISGVLAGWSWVMLEHAKKQIEVSTNRAKLLREMKRQFDTTNASINPCTSQDRNDPGRPNCYCYNSDYSRNGSRSTTGVCQKITVDTRVKASNYFGIDEGNFKGCISSNSQFDESCKCRQTNSCMKALKGSLNGLDAGTISMIKSNIQPLEKLTHGMMGSGSVDAEGISNNATRMLAATEKLEEKVLTPTQKNEKKKLTTQFENDSIKAASGLPSPLDTSTGSNLPSNPLEASKMLQSEIDKASSVDSDGNQGHSGSGTVALPSGGGSETGDMGLGSGGSQEKLDFGLDTSASQEAEVAEVMKNELDYGNNDVNTNSTSNLFEVLSNRYQKSGMKRLFESNE